MGAGVEHHIHMHVVRAGAATPTSCRCWPILGSCLRRSSRPMTLWEVLDVERFRPQGSSSVRHPRPLRLGDGRQDRLVGRAFARVLADVRGKPTDGLRVALEARHADPGARDGRAGVRRHGRGGLLRDRRRDGRHRVEMLYFLVGSRKLDGGAMMTASHNPKAYTGSSWCARGRWRSLATPESARSGRRSRRGCPSLAGGSSVSDVDIYPEFHEHAALDRPGVHPGNSASSSTGAAAAGPMVGPLIRRLGLDAVEMYWTPSGEFPDHEPDPLLPENQELIIDRVRAEKADLGIAWDGDADRCFFINRSREFVDGDFLTALIAAQVLSRDPRHDPLRRPGRAAPCRTLRRPPRRNVACEPRRTRVLQDRHARARRRVQRRGVRALLLPRVLVRRLGGLAGPVRPQAPLEGTAAARRPGRRAAVEVLRQRRDQFRGGRPTGEDGGSRRRPRRCGNLLARRRLGRLPELALQRPASNTEPLCASASNRSSRARTWSASRTRSWR